MNKKIIIEFNGTPGVGCSTLIKEVKSLLRTKNIQFVSPPDKKKIIKNIIPLVKTLYITCLLKPKSIKYFWIFFKRIGLYQMFIHEERNNKTIQIYDEGIFKISSAITQRSYRNSLDFINTCFRYIRKPDILIILDANPETILKRRKERSRGSFDKITYNNLIKRHKEQREFDQNVSEVFNKDVKILTLNHNSKKDITKNADKVVEMLESYITG